MKVRSIRNMKEIFKAAVRTLARRILYNSRDSMYLGNNRALTATIWGHMVFVDTRDISVTPHILIKGFWEMWITRVFMDSLQKGMTVVDIGANIGYYSLIAASMIGEQGRVFAFEANPDIFEILFRNIEINSYLNKTTLINKAVFDKTGSLNFHNYKLHHGGSSVCKITEESQKEFRDEVEVIEVEAVSLDDYFSDKDIKVDLIKIDAEGSEARIFKGMEKIVKDNPQLTIICEFTPSMVQSLGDDPGTFLEEIESCGFTLKKISQNSKAVNVSADELLNTAHSDLYLER